MRTIMQIRPIRTDKDHRAALAEIEKLWGASIGTPEGDKLDILVTLVETYEETALATQEPAPVRPGGCATLRDRGTRSQSGRACRHSRLAFARVRSPGSAPPPYPRDDPKNQCKLENPGRSPRAALSDRCNGSLRVCMRFFASSRARLRPTTANYCRSIGTRRRSRKLLKVVTRVRDHHRLYRT